MNRVSQIILSLILTGGFCLGTFPTYSVSQVTNERKFNDFFDDKNGDESIRTPTEKESSEALDYPLKPEFNSEVLKIEEVEIVPKPETNLKIKEMVEVLSPLPKVKIDASDFEDPFFRVRGFQKNTEKVLQPGTTLDGVQFQSYGDSNKFIENFYKESNFSIEDVYGKIEYLERRGGCYTCHQ